MEVLRERHLCEKLKVSPNTARKIRREDPTFPKARVIVGDVEGWLSEEIEAWLRQRPVAPKSVREAGRRA